MGEADKGWAWVCLAASFLSYTFIHILDYSTGTIQLALLEVYHHDVAKTSIIVATCSTIFFGAAPLSGFIVNATNCRTSCIIGGILMFVGVLASAFVHNLNGLLVTYGIIAGLGKSLSGVASSLSVGYNFSRRRSIASGIFMTGGGVGMLVGSTIVRSLLDYYGLDGTFLMLSAIILHVPLFGMLLRPTKHESDSGNNVTVTSNRRKSIAENQLDLLKKHMFSNLEIFKIPSFLMFGLCMLFVHMGSSVIIIHLQSFSYSTGISKDSAASLMSLMGVGSIISRLLVGMSTSTSGLNGMVVFMGQNAVVGILTVLFPLYASTFRGQMVYSFLHGLYTGGLSAQLIPLTAEVVQVHLLSSALGVLFFGMGTSWLIGPYVSGYILDNGGTYSHCFILSGGCFLLSFFLVMLTVLLKSDVQTKNGEKCPETVPLSNHSLTIEP